MVLNLELVAGLEKVSNGKFISGSVQLKETQGEVRSAPAVEGADEDVPF
jgi:hypothetical protein